MRGFMYRPTLGWLVAVATASVISTALAHPDDHDDRARGNVIQEPAAAKRTVHLGQVAFSSDGVLTANVINRSTHPVRDVRLLIRYDWIWANERSPGDDSPGRAIYHEVDADIPVFGTVPIRFSPAPPLPIREDGRFVPSVEVSRFTQLRYKKKTKKR